MLKDFLLIIEGIICIDDKEIYHILKNTLNDYKTDFKINYQRGMKYECFEQCKNVKIKCNF